MAARWVGVSRPHNENTAARHGVARTFQDAWHALGVLGILFMAAAMNFALYPDALAAVVSGERQVVGFVPEDPSQPSAPAVVVDETEVRLLAATVWGEARSEGEDGMRAVAHVMVNRIGQRFGEDLATVILSPKQFSVWNRGDPNRRLVQAFVANPARYTAADDPHWVTAQRVAREVLSGQSVDPTGGALFYHTRAIRPRWAGQGVGRQVIGAHVFYTDVPDAGVRDTPRVIDVAQYFGRGLRIDNPTTRERVHGVIQSADAAATPTLNGVPITQVTHAASP